MPLLVSLYIGDAIDKIFNQCTR